MSTNRIPSAVKLAPLLMAGLCSMLAQQNAASATTPIFVENFEDGNLDSRITVTTIGTFGTQPGIQENTKFGSKKAFGFGLSKCGVDCHENYVTKFTITFTQPTQVASISFKEMELFDNYGSGGYIYADGNLIGTFGRAPYNDGKADTKFRSRNFFIGNKVSTIEIRVADITYASEIFIDDLRVNSDDSAAASVGANIIGSNGSIAVTCLNDSTGQSVSFSSKTSSFDCKAKGLIIKDNERFTITASANAMPFADHRYEAMTGCGTWSDCKTAAEALGAHLVTIESQTEGNLIYSKFKGVGTYWIGLTDSATEGTFLWVTEEPLSYRNWASGQPNNKLGAEDCVGVLTTASNAGKWDDLNCDKSYPAIIEYE